MKKRLRKEPTTREKIGLSMEEILPFAKCSKSALAMYETNKRSLPTWPLIRLGAIEICINRPGMEETMTEAATGDQELSIQLLKQRLAACSLSIYRANKQLQKMKEEYQCCLNMVHVAKWMPEVLPTLLPSHELDSKALQWAEDSGRIAAGKLGKCSLPKQQLLQLKIDALQYEAGKIQEQLEAMGQAQ